jgi:predicted acyl esterase
LLDDCGDIATESPVHYHAGADKQWQAADSWPPAGLAAKQFYPADAYLGKGALGETLDDSVIEFTVDSAASTGLLSRWNTVLGAIGGSASYAATVDTSGLGLGGTSPAARLTYSTVGLLQDLTIVGSATITLQIELTGGADAAVFVYLEDVAPDGTSSYVTEGQVRAAHSITSRSSHATVGLSDQFERTFQDDALAPFDGVGAIVEIAFEPAAYGDRFLVISSTRCCYCIPHRLA